jgi:hypothetical protein
VVWCWVFGAFVTVLVPVLVLGWVFPEHRDIAVLAVHLLSSSQQASLQSLRTEARVWHEARLCAEAGGAAQGPKPDCIDYAAWTAIAGDHSCSARDMLGTVLNAPWIIGVAQVSARLKTQLAAAQRRDQRVNAVRDSDLSLQRTDPEYVTRATSNNAHFLLARPKVDIQTEDYARLALGTNAELNAVATYIWYHLRALAKAQRIAESGFSGNRAELVLAALADEAFADHFLEDSFAAGHVTGNWGNSAVRKGTHDYYSEHGVSLVTWSGHPFVALGDAYMLPADAERAATAVAASLAQLLDAFAGKNVVGAIEDVAPAQSDAFDVCHGTHFPVAVGSGTDLQAVVPIVAQTPVPTLGAGAGELPRFRSELGPFIGLSSAVRGGVLTRGFASTQMDASTTGGLGAALRFGVGLEGVLNESSDGLTVTEVGFRADKRASGAATVPGRSALTARFRAPFWLVPGDLILAAPVLAFVSRDTLMKMAVQSASGGLIPWQAGIATRIGRFQFVLGREVALSFYHNNSRPSVRDANARSSADQRHSYFLELTSSGVSHSRAPPVPDFLDEPKLRFDDSTLRGVRRADEIGGRLTHWSTEAQLRHHLDRGRPRCLRLAPLRELRTCYDTRWPNDKQRKARRHGTNPLHLHLGDSTTGAGLGL